MAFRSHSKPPASVPLPTDAELDQLDLTRWDRKSFFDPACGLSRREFFHLITSPGTFVPDDSKKEVA